MLYNGILFLYNGTHLKTSDLQFAYKSRHSTVMCHNVVKETINYYLNSGSEIYSCMLDASKAFDRLRYDKLFELLIKQDFPPIRFRNVVSLSYFIVIYNVISVKKT